MNTYFSRITSLADLKKQYRTLAIANHPDKGGDEEKMKAINAEFSALYEIWRTRKEVDFNGYEDDFVEATAKQYTDYVWNEYRWKGSRYDPHKGRKELASDFRTWVKATYPGCKFSITSTGYRSISVCLLEADFRAFVDGNQTSGSFNHYWPDNNTHFTPRCIEVLKNVTDYIQSFNYDASDPMTDYFNVNFYLDISVGRYSRHFKYVPMQLKSKERGFKRKLGPAGKAVRDALGNGNTFVDQYRWHNGTRTATGRMVLGKDDDSKYPLWISQPSLRAARLAKLAAVGIAAHAEGHEIVLDYYSDDLKRELEAEERAEDERERAFNRNGA